MTRAAEPFAAKSAASAPPRSSTRPANAAGSAGEAARAPRKRSSEASAKPGVADKRGSGAPTTALFAFEPVENLPDRARFAIGAPDRTVDTEQTVEPEAREAERQQPELARLSEPGCLDQGRAGKGMAEGQLAGNDSCPEPERTHRRNTLEAGIASVLEESGEKRQAALSRKWKQNIESRALDSDDQQVRRRAGGGSGERGRRADDRDVARAPRDHHVETAGDDRDEQDETPRAVAAMVNGVQKGGIESQDRAEREPERRANQVGVDPGWKIERVVRSVNPVRQRRGGQHHGETPWQ